MDLCDNFLSDSKCKPVSFSYPELSQIWKEVLGVEFQLDIEDVIKNPAIKPWNEYVTIRFSFVEFCLYEIQPTSIPPYFQDGGLSYFGYLVFCPNRFVETSLSFRDKEELRTELIKLLKSFII